MDRFATATMLGVVQNLPRPSAALLNAFFSRVFQDPSEEIHFDLITGKRRITPLVHPTRAGRIVDSRGYEAKTFKPAYAKDKRTWNPAAPLKRIAGERIGGNLTPEQRIDALLAENLEDQVQMLTMRKEVMASEALRTGKVTVAGDGFPTVVVDFGRNVLHTVTLTTNDRWSVAHADSDPLSDLEVWSGRLQENGGGVGRRVVMAPDAWRAFRTRLIARGEFEQLFNTLRASTGSNIEAGPIDAAPGERYVGTISTFDFFVYDETYVDDAGVTQHVMPSGTVIMGDDKIEGVQAHAAIQDEEAGYQALEYFPKSWVEKDPGVRWLLLQSAPLVVPLNPNASLSAVVL